MNLTRALAVTLLIPFSALAGSPLGTADMSRANGAAAIVVKERMARERP